MNFDNNPSNLSGPYSTTQTVSYLYFLTIIIILIYIF